MPAAPPRGSKRAAGGVRGALARVQGLNAAFLQASRARADAASSSAAVLPSRPSASVSSEQEALERRARRFALDWGGGGGPSAPRSGDASSEPGLDSLPLDAPPLVGTCARVRKPYFRLTSAPRPDEVRPPAVLREALADAKRLWVERREYGEARDAFRSIRQDAVLQGAARRIEARSRAADAEGERRGKSRGKRGGHASAPPPPPPSVTFHLAVLEVAAEAYGAHARLTLEVGDWRELRRCVEPLLGVLERLAEYAAEWERDKAEGKEGEGSGGPLAAEAGAKGKGGGGPLAAEAGAKGKGSGGPLAAEAGARGKGGGGPLAAEAGARGKGGWGEAGRDRVGGKRCVAAQGDREAKKRRAGADGGGRDRSPAPASSPASGLPAPSHPRAHYANAALEFAAYDLAVAAASGADAWYDAERRADRIEAGSARGAGGAAPPSPPPPSPGLATLRHARRACRAFFAREAVLFARLHAEAPRMLPYALDPLAEALREISYAAVVAAYRPSLDGRALAAALGLRKRRRALAYARERGGNVQGDTLVLTTR